MSEPKVKSILEIKPIDLVGATRMFEVKPNVKTIYAGWTRFPLFDEKLSIDITTVDSNSTLDPELLPQILRNSISLSKSTGPHTTPDGVSIYYVMNAADANAVVASIKQYAAAHPFPERFNVDEIITHIGNIEVELLHRRSSCGRRKIKRRQIKKMKTKRRQIKKMKTTSKK